MYDIVNTQLLSKFKLFSVTCDTSKKKKRSGSLKSANYSNYVAIHLPLFPAVSILGQVEDRIRT